MSEKKPAPQDLPPKTAESDVPEDIVEVVRYMDFAKFTSLVARSSLFFSVADRLGDRYEGELGSSEVKWIQAKLHQQDPSIAFDVQYGPFEKYGRWLREQWSRQMFTVAMNCWYEGRDESEAMWSLYLSRGTGVALVSTVGRVLSSVPHELTCARMQYTTWEERPMSGLDPIAALQFKGRQFQHEREIRFFAKLSPDDLNAVALMRQTRGNMPTHVMEAAADAQGNPPVVVATTQDGIALWADLSELIAEVVVSPGSPDWMLEAASFVTSSAGLNVQVGRSSLDKRLFGFPRWF